MNNRSGLVVFFLFLFLAVMILFQILSMIQADRLYERLNGLIETLSVDRQTVATYKKAEVPGDVSKDEYPGDEGDWLVRSLSGEPTTLYGVLAASTWSTRWIVSGNIFESLLEYEPDAFKFCGKLAEDFSISEDGLEIYFKLRDGIHFSDGKPVTTDDVIFTFETITNPGVDSASLANYFQDVKGYERINDKEIKFYMKKVYFLSLGFLGGLPIHPKHIYKFDNPEEFNKRRTNPIGSGPYVFEKWNVGKEVVLRRNENYWGKKPKIKRRVYRFITNDIAALQALQAGDVDYLRPLPDQFAQKSVEEEFQKRFYCLSYWDAGNTGYFWIGWNQLRPFFADRKVRLAMTHLIDRDAIRNYILRNPEALVPTGPFYIYGPQNDPNIKPWPYDPEQAKKLLDEAGWIDRDGDGIRDKNGVPFRFKYMISSGIYLHEQIAKLVKDSASKVGIEVIPEPYEWSVFSERVTNRKFDAVSMAWGGSVEGDPYQIWHSSQIEGRGSNYVGFNNPEADAIIEEARQTLDEKKRNGLYHCFHKILHEEQPYTFIYTRPEQRFLDKRFENVKVHKLGLDSHEWYVPKNVQRYK
ncbi:MAG: peptide-binding protein [Planctomycetota bacterium]|jgi:peptide/nickel transport system substrate-binding protein